MTFGDVNLAEDQVQGKYAGSPGGGGWPTIRAYNEKTGYEGAFAGDWKDANNLDGAMCDVFGAEETMQSYVEELGGVLGGILCDINCLCGKEASGECSKKQMDYYDKFTKGPMADVESRLKLLSASMAKSGKSDAWMSQRVALLRLISKTRALADAKDEL